MRSRGGAPGVGLSQPSHQLTSTTIAITWGTNTISNVNVNWSYQPGSGILFYQGSFNETAGTNVAAINIPLPEGFMVRSGLANSPCGMVMQPGITGMSVPTLYQTAGNNFLFTATSTGAVSGFGFFATVFVYG